MRYKFIKKMKFRKATKKIMAVAGASAVASASVFGAAANYPQNFIEDGELSATVVIGSKGDADMAAAESIVRDLRSDFASGSSMTTLKYKMSNSDGDSVNGVDSGEALNFGDTLQSVTETLDEDVSNLLEDGDLDNNDYSQELQLTNGEFSYRVFDEVRDDDEVAKAGLYYKAGTSYAVYTLEFKDDVDVNDSDAQEEFIGETLNIMGNEFTVVEIENDKLVLLGGSNTVPVGEEEEVTVTVDDESYEIVVREIGNSDGDTEIYITVNGESKFIEQYEIDEVGGISVGVVSLLESSNDEGKGYAELVLGGQKVELTTSKVKINDEDLDDVNDGEYEDYSVGVQFYTGATDKTDLFEGIIITYSVEENMVLEAGDSLTDILFDSFSVDFNGVSDVEYSKFEISTSKEEVSFDGELHNGDDIPSEFRLTTDKLENATLYLGTDSDRIYFQGSNFDIDSKDLIDSDGQAIAQDSTAKTVKFNLNTTDTDVSGNMIFSWIADDEFYLYEISSTSRSDLEADFTELFSADKKDSVDLEDFKDDLEFNTGAAGSDAENLTIDTNELGSPILYLENYLEMNFSAVETAGLTFEDDSAGVDLVFDYNSGDIDSEDPETVLGAFTIGLTRALDFEKDNIELSLTTEGFTNGDEGEEVEDDSDYKVYVDPYGTMITVDEEDLDNIVIEVPDEEVKGLVSVTLGSGSAGTTSEVSVRAENVAEKVSELESKGYSIVERNSVDSDDVTVSVEDPVVDRDVDDMENLIVVGGPAVNAIARDLLGISVYTPKDAGVSEGEYVHRYYRDENVVLVYGYSAADTRAGVNALNSGTWQE